MKIEKCGVTRNIRDENWPEYAEKGYVKAEVLEKAEKSKAKVGEKVKKAEKNKNSNENTEAKKNDKSSEQENETEGGTDDRDNGEETYE